SMEKTNQINYMSTFLAAVVGLLILAADPIEGGFANGLLGTRGLLTAFLAAFITVNIYKVCIKNNVTIRLPEEVPPNIAQVFKDVAISYANIEANVQLVQAGMHADKILNPVTQTFVVTMGGTGATLV
ncbi:PTS transporter subunit EIIC, partial [Streptococcus pneumoniae]|uniref:PTS transporter subunit EIIC n=1 Tax=Streptococcus pneumoniae TaxID=1313 RepID=UPI001885A9F9